MVQKVRAYKKCLYILYTTVLFLTVGSTTNASNGITITQRAQDCGQGFQKIARTFETLGNSQQIGLNEFHPADRPDPAQLRFDTTTREKYDKFTSGLSAAIEREVLSGTELFNDYKLEKMQNGALLDSGRQEKDKFWDLEILDPWFSSVTTGALVDNNIRDSLGKPYALLRIDYPSNKIHLKALGGKETAVISFRTKKLMMRKMTFEFYSKKKGKMDRDISVLVEDFGMGFPQELRWLSEILKSTPREFLQFAKDIYVTSMPYLSSKLNGEAAGTAIGNNIALYRGAFHNRSQLASVFYHELAHTIAYKLNISAGRGGTADPPPEYSQAMREDNARNNLKSVSSYGETNEKEDFAEAFTQYLAYRKNPEWLNRYPKRALFFDGLMQTLGSDRT